MRLSEIVEAQRDSGTGLMIDNPGGDWEKNKQAYAMQEYDPTAEGSGAKGMYGTVTGYYGANIFVPVDLLNSLPGVYNEQLTRNDPGGHKFKDIMASVKERGFLFDHVPFITVNHLGEAYISEGNHRIAVAAALGLEAIPVEIRYFNGGEAAEGPMHPSKLAGFERKRI